MNCTACDTKIKTGRLCQDCQVEVDRRVKELTGRRGGRAS